MAEARALRSSAVAKRAVAVSFGNLEITSENKT